MLRKIFSGICAGILITIGGSVFLACENKVVGAVLFTVALLCICIKGYSLYTGRIGFVVENHDKEYFSALLLGLLGNGVGTVLGGVLIRFALPKLGDAAAALCEAKLASQTFPQTLVRGVFCGILMYLAVSIYKEKDKLIGVIFCIPVFILAGFEHSIADLFYFAASGIVSLPACGFVWTVVLGNTLGAVILPLLVMKKRT